MEDEPQIAMFIYDIYVQISEVKEITKPADVSNVH